MNINFLKRNLAFYLSIATLSGNYTFAGKKQNINGKNKLVKPKLAEDSSKKLLEIEVPKKNKESTSNFLQPNFWQSNLLQLNFGQPNLLQLNLGQPNLLQSNPWQSNFLKLNFDTPKSSRLKPKKNEKSSTNIFNSRLTKDYELPKYFSIMYSNGGKSNVFSILCSPRKLGVFFKKDISKRLPLENLLPCQNIKNSYHPLLLASLLKLAGFIIEPMEPPFRISKGDGKGYYLSYARKYFCCPNVQVAFSKRERLVNPTIEEQEEDKNISKNLEEFFKNEYIDEYTDESGKNNIIRWSAKTLIYLTILLVISQFHAYSYRLKLLTEFAKDENNINGENSIRLIKPLLDNFTGNDQRAKIPDFYRKFYLDILQTIDPDRKNDFKLMEPFNMENKMEKVNLDKKAEFKVQSVDTLKFS